MQVLKDHRAFFSLYFSFLLIAGYTLFVYSKSSIHLYFNQFNSSFSDQFFKYLTHLGDGWAVVILGAIFFIFKSRISGLLIWLTGIIGGIVSQSMKHWVFGDTPRPLKYFTEIDIQNIHIVDGVSMNMVNSLPSGHTTAAFGMGLALAMIFNSRKADISFFILCLTISLSRIYLSQHFLEDIFLGSIIGVLSAIIAQSILYNPNKEYRERFAAPLYSRS